MSAVVAATSGIVAVVVVLGLPAWRARSRSRASGASEPDELPRLLRPLAPPLAFGALGGIVVAAATVVGSGGTAYVWGALAAPVVLLVVLLLLAGIRVGRRYD